jgi:hypothetical protein
MLRDPELKWGEKENISDYAVIHAWRALAQLQAEAAIEPLLDLVLNKDLSERGEWIAEEVPTVLAQIGLPALAPAAERLAKTHHMRLVPSSYARALMEIAEDFPETRQEVISHLTSFLDRAVENDPEQNALVICNLLDMNAAEAWPSIERAYAGDRVETFICGSADWAKFDLGFGPEPTYPQWQFPPHQADRHQPSAKERADKRAKKRKAEKRKQKRRR